MSMIDLGGLEPGRTPSAWIRVQASRRSDARSSGLSLLWGRLEHNTHDELVRSKLVGTLYDNPSVLLMGTLSGMAAGVTGAFSTHDPLMMAGAAAMLVIGLWRIGLSEVIRRTCRQRSARRLERLYEIGAFSWALLSGLMAARALLIGLVPYLEVLMVSYALLYGSGAAARSAGRPPIAIGQLMLTATPIFAATLVIATPPLLVLGACIAVMLAGWISITLSVFHTLREQIVAAQSSAEMAERMRALARTDAVTGLTNRAGLDEDLKEILATLPAGRQLALLWFDLDRFKETNDTLGHPVGDGVLGEIGARLGRRAPAGAVVARFGGDEFVIAAQVTCREEAQRIAHELNQDVGRPMLVSGHRIDCGASLGVALLPDDAGDIETLMQRADTALYDAKLGGRGQVRFFDAAMTRKLVRRKEIERELRSAIQRDELSVYFQPVVNLKTGRICCFEALVRWFHPEQGELLPAEFVPIAEETGVIITLGNWIAKQAARACANWPEDVSVAVNLSPLQIRAPGAALGILSALRETGLNPRRLELELTESLLLDDDVNTARFIEELSAAGVRFALDDFGTGYSSLHYIKKFPFRKIKVDRSFVSGPDTGRKSDAIIRAVAEMGTTLGMEIVAEGLETSEQVQTVRWAGCTLGQGYYFSRAVPEHRATKLLEEELLDGSVGSFVG